MTITKVLNYKKKNKNMYEVEFDNGKTYKLYDDVIIKYELLIDKNITDKKLNDIVCENELLDSYYKALKYISVKMRTEKEMRSYLKKNEYSSVSIDYAIDLLKDNGYLNEDIYTKAYINDAINLSLDGPKKIQDNLIKLGINESTINKYLDMEDNAWTDRINIILDKKARINKSSSSLFKNKMYTYLYALGYGNINLREILDEYKIDTSNAFIREADKIWNKLITKYDKKDSILKFKNKMYLKGYTSDEINNYIEKADN